MRVNLRGELGEKFGYCYTLDVASPSECIQALGFQLPGFIEYLNRDDDYYMVKAGAATVATVEDLRIPARGSIDIIPVVVGAGGNGFLGILTGAALIAGSFLLPGVSLLGVNLSAAAGLIGASLVLNGISQLISPTPRREPTEDRRESQIIDPYGQIAAQGARVPVVYGEVKLGNLLPISQYVTNYDWVQIGDPAAQYTRVTSVELPYDVTAVAPYTYAYSSRTFRNMDATFLSNNDPFTGMVVVGNTFRVRTSFSTSPQGLNIRTAYAVQRVRVFSGVTGYTGAATMRVLRGDGAPLTGVINLTSGGWVDLNLSANANFRVKYPDLLFEFNSPINYGFTAVGEIQLFGALGLNEGVADILG